MEFLNIFIVLLLFFSLRYSMYKRSVSTFLYTLSLVVFIIDEIPTEHKVYIVVAVATLLNVRAIFKEDTDKLIPGAKNG
jgi:hypothetical protein